MVVPSVFAADIPAARRSLPFAKVRGPFPGSLGLLAGKPNNPRKTSEVRFGVRYARSVLEFFRISGAAHVDPVDIFRVFDPVCVLLLPLPGRR